MEEKKNIQELNALISLIDEPDDQIFSQISDKIFSYGMDSISLLEDAWDKTFDPSLQNRIEGIIHDVQYANTYQNIRKWYLSGGEDLLQGFMLISKTRYPKLDGEKITKQIGQLTQDVWLELNKELTALAKVRVMNHILFDIHHFEGNLGHISSPSNNLINKVLEMRKGNPLSLSIIYLIIAQSLHVPVFGINLPQHFIIGYADEKKEGDKWVADKTNIRFYINAFRRGKIFSKNDIETFLLQMNVKPDKSHFLPCDNITMIKRLIANLILSYEAEGEKARAVELRNISKALR